MLHYYSKEGLKINIIPSSPPQITPFDSLAQHILGPMSEMYVPTLNLSSTKIYQGKILPTYLAYF